jgi:hypothetical protein
MSAAVSAPTVFPAQVFGRRSPPLPSTSNGDRLDLFLEHAWGRTGEPATAWERIPGVGTAVNFRTPWNTILRAELGKSLLPDRYDGLGSTTLQVLLLKPLK